VLTRTETAAAIMAAVTGELSGTAGVVLTGIGPGAASAVNGIAYAPLERAPVILLSDGPASSLHQAFDQNALFAPITKMQGRLRPKNGRADIEACIELRARWPFPRGRPKVLPAMPDPMTLADHIVEALAGRGVRRMFGIPGGGSSLALIDAAGAVGIDFVLTRTETAAAIMAAVTGELSGTPGVVLTGIGPGAASAVNGTAYAQLERAPVILLSDGPASSLHQAFDQNALFAPITKMQGRLRPENGRADIEACIEAALTPPWGPVHLDLTAADAAAPVSGRETPEPVTSKSETETGTLDRARHMLARSRRPVLLVGLDARHGENPVALRRLADALACPVLLTYKAKGVLPDSHPNAVGMFTGAAAEADCIERSDLLVLFGLDPVEIIPGAWRYDTPILDLRSAEGAELPAGPECRVIGRLADTVQGLLAADTTPEWSLSEIAALRNGMRARSAMTGDGHTAQTVVETLSREAPAGCRIAVDSGAHMFSALTFWRADEPFGVLKSNGLSTMGFALPAAIASALQEPERPVVAVTGDGGLMMCLSELTTAVERRCPVVVVVLNDAALSLIDIKQQRQQRKSLGVRYERVDLAAAARALGCRAWRLGADEEVPPVLREAFAGDGPALIDVTIDPSGYGDQLTALRG
jgi:acetolactate synthase-1/2/3 large subunit